MSMPQLSAVLSDVNLYQAWSKVLENQGCAGSDGQSLALFMQRLPVELDTLRDEVVHGTYQPRPLLRVMVDKPDGGQRPLSIPTVRDRVLQTAVTQVLEPVFEAEFEDCSFAYRKGRSVDQALQRIQLLQRQGYQWVVDADIQQFFDNIDHALLMATVQRLVADAGILQLVRGWLHATVFDGERLVTLDKGVPQGSPLSPLLSNLYLNRLDESLLDEGLCLVRFADDFVILCKSRDRAEQALELTESLLAELRLQLHAGKTRVVHFDQGFRFLGAQFIRSLLIKTEADPPLFAQSAGAEPVVPTLVPPPTAMQQAFQQARLDSRDFPAAADNLPLPDGDASCDSEPLLRTLYLLQHGQVLGKESERLVVRQERQVVREIPAIKVDQIMVFGNAQITTQAMQFCLSERIPIYLLSAQGQYYGVIDSFDTEPVLLQRLARRRDEAAFAAAIESLKTVLARLDSVQTLDELRGFEGHAAKLYFQALAAVLDAAWGFSQRQRQPPGDPINAMLSYGYTLLFYNVYSLLRSRGFNPQVGFLHGLRAGHPALASDMMEEFRALIVDAVVCRLALNRQVTPADFELSAAEQGCLMKPATRQLFIKALEEKFNAAVTHPNAELKLDYRRCIEYQIQHLAQVLRGQAAVYQPMVLR